MCSKKDFNVLAYSCFFLHDTSRTFFECLVFFYLASVTARKNVLRFTLFCAGTHLNFFPSSVVVPYWLFWVFYLFHNMISHVCAVVFCESVCGVIRTVFLESFYVWCGWCQSYVSMINVLMVTHINSLFANHAFTSSRCVFLSTFNSLQQHSAGLPSGTFTSLHP